MKKRLLAMFLTLCLCCSLLPVPAMAVKNVTLGATEFEELEDFLQRLNWVGFYYSAEGSFNMGWPVRNSEYSYTYNNVFEELLIAYSLYCYNDDLYPGELRSEHLYEQDPLGQFYGGSYIKTNAKKLDWVLENIFNCSKTDIERMKASSLTFPVDSRADLYTGGYNYFGHFDDVAECSDLDFYYLDGYYYSRYGNVDDSSFVISIDGIKAIRDKYLVSFVLEDDDTYNRYFALVSRKNIGEKDYWSLYHLESVADLEEPFDNGGFFDVSIWDYYHQSVLWAVERGLAYGTSLARFSPSDTCTKAQILTFLWRYYGQPEPTVTSNPFPDINPNDYYYKAALWAAEEGLATGTLFQGSEPCTRSMVVKYLWQLAGKSAAYGSSFTDVPPGEDSQAVAWAVNKGIVNGTGNGKFSPNDTCTRAQIVTFLYRLENPLDTPKPETAWKQAYMTFLQNQSAFGPFSFGTSEEVSKQATSFQLAYIDGDNIPELVIGPYFPCHADSAKVYTYYGGQVVFVGDFGSNGCFAYIPNGNSIANARNGGGAFGVEFSTINNRQDMTIKTFLSYGILTLEYEINGEKVSESTYMSELQQMDEATRYQFIALSSEIGFSIDDGMISLIATAPDSLVMGGSPIQNISEWSEWEY